MSSHKQKKARSRDSLKVSDALNDMFGISISATEIPLNTPGRTERSELNEDSTDDKVVPSSTLTDEYVGEIGQTDSLKVSETLNDMFGISISSIEIPLDTPGRIERSQLDEDSTDDKVVANSTLIEEYVREIRAPVTPPQTDPFKVSETLNDMFGISISTIGIPNNAPGRTERSQLDEDSTDDKVVVNSTPIEEYVGEIRAPVAPLQKYNPPPMDGQYSISLSRQPPRLTLTDPSGSLNEFQPMAFSSTNFGDLRTFVSAPLLPTNSTTQITATSDERYYDSRQNETKPFDSASHYSTKSSSEDDRAVVENMSPENPFYSSEGTLYTVKSTVPIPVNESPDITAIIKKLQREIRRSILQASPPVGTDEDSSTALSRRVAFESSGNKPFGARKSYRSQSQKPKNTFIYKAPAQKPHPPVINHSSTESETFHEIKNSTPNTVAQSRVDLHKTQERKNCQDLQSSKKPKSSHSHSCHTSESEEILSDMELFRKELETWLRQRVDVMGEELKTLYKNKAKNVKSSVDPCSLLVKSKSDRKDAAVTTRFPYYPSGVIIPKCKSDRKKAGINKRRCNRKMVLLNIYDNGPSTDDRSPTDDQEIGELEESEHEGTTDDPNNETTNESNPDETFYDADLEEEQQSAQSMNAENTQNIREIRSSYLSQWIKNNARDLNNNAAFKDKEILKTNVGSISNIQNSELSMRSNIKSGKVRAKFPKNADPVQLSINEATQMYEDALRDFKQDGNIFHQKLAERFTKMQLTGLRKLEIQKKLHEADIRRAVLMDAKVEHLQRESGKKMEKAFLSASDKIESQNKAYLMKMIEAKCLETKGVLKLFKDTMNIERRTILELKTSQKTRTRKMYAEVNEQISKLENLLHRGTSDLDKISSKLRKTSSIETIELLNSLHKKGYQQLHTEISKCISRLCSSRLLQQ